MQNKEYLYRVLFLVCYVVVLFFLFGGLGHSILNGQATDVFLFSSLVVLAINMLIMSYFFETPKDVIASSLNAMVLLTGLYCYESFPKTLFSVLFVYASICLVLSVGSVFFYNPNTTGWKQNLSNFLKNISTTIGTSKIIFSILIISVMISVYSYEDIAFYSLVSVWLILLASEKLYQILILVFSFIVSLFYKANEKPLKLIGRITAIQAKETFIVDLVDMNRRPSLKLFDFVEFRYGAGSFYFRGLVIDRYYLDTKQKIKVLKTWLKDITEANKSEFSTYQNNVVYKVDKNNWNEKDRKFLNGFVGIVIEKSDMTQIVFEYSSNKLVSNGDLLSVTSKNKEGKDVSILYQVTQAQTDIKTLENKNEIGLIKASATQLGVWQSQARNFENYGWVPNMNTPVMLATGVKGPAAKEGEMKLGKIDGTDFDVIANINDLVTHHTAILGTTGTGKSVFARNIIKTLSEKGNKVFCIDFTGEVKRFLTTKELVEQPENVATNIHRIVEENAKFPSQRCQDYLSIVTDTEKNIKTALEGFINDQNSNIGILELPDLYNTEETLEYTKFFFKSLFDLAKEGSFNKEPACVFLEEAHTLIPEWNSVAGTDDKTARRLTNTIAQIALQGRKYNVGLLIVAQRTANVSKTILTQCNTIISFKQFDNTSKDFLVNHFGNAFTDSLAMLKNRCAIIAGKALISDVPIIFKVPEISEEVQTN